MNQPLAFPLLLRFAAKLRQRLAAGADEPLLLPQSHWNELSSVYLRLQYARRRNWNLASRHLQLSAACLLEAFQKRLEECRTSLATASGGMWLASLAEIVADLRALEDEFASLRIDLRQRQFSVVTDDIVLESVCLGPFRITLELPSSSQESPHYFVEALEPNPFTDDSRTVHPHVHDQQLCEGEGKVAIRQALQQGRVFDFFVLLRQVLETYNAGSAYASLSDWEGRICDCCNRRTSEDESTSCDRCGHHVCFDCSSSCDRCERYCCDSCYTTCQACGNSICVSCSTACEVCHSDFCERCLSDTTCSICKPDKEPESDDQATEQKPIDEADEDSSTAPVHPLGLGQAAVPA